MKSEVKKRIVRRLCELHQRGIFLPFKTEKYSLISLLPSYWVEALTEVYPRWEQLPPGTFYLEWITTLTHVQKVHYWDDNACQQHQLNFREGVLYCRDDTVFDTSALAVTGADKKGVGAFVVSQEEALFVFTHERGKTQHSSPVHCKPVIAAGCIEVKATGEICFNASSGHYGHPQSLINMIRFLHDHGYGLKKVTVDLRSHQLLKALEKRFGDSPFKGTSIAGSEATNIRVSGEKFYQVAVHCSEEFLAAYQQCAQDALDEGKTCTVEARYKAFCAAIEVEFEDLCSQIEGYESPAEGSSSSISMSLGSSSPSSRLSALTS